MSPKEVLSKFVIHQMMVKNAKYITDIANRSLSYNEHECVAFKATKKALPNKVAQVEAASLNDEEMVFVIKRFKNTLKERNDFSNKGKSRGSVSASSVVKMVILLLIASIMRMTRTRKRTSGEESREEEVLREEG
jgi:hypothetical protein